MRLLAFGISGLLLGSFLTVVIHRVPRGEGIARGRSRCPGCGREIGAVDNIPVFSWLLLRGRCRHCEMRISPVYPLIEAGTAGLFVAAASVFERLHLAIGVAAFLAMMLAIAVIDARHRIVPNRLVYPALVTFAFAIAVGHVLDGGVDIFTGLIGMVAYSSPLLLVALVVPGGMGMGDVKLTALIGLVLGALGLSYVAVAAGIGVLSGGLGALGAMVVLRCGRKQQMPFGPFLAAGAAVALVAGPAISRGYLSLVGLQ